MGDIKSENVMAITGYNYLLPIINQYQVTTLPELNMVIEAFEAGKQFAKDSSNGTE